MVAHAAQPQPVDELDPGSLERPLLDATPGEDVGKETGCDLVRGDDRLRGTDDDVKPRRQARASRPAHVSRLDDIEALVKQAAEVGPIDALINVAGVGRVHSVLADDADVEQLLAVNLLAPIRLMRAVVPIMRTRGHGSIVNIGSIAGEIGVDGLYSASKFGLRGMTDSVRRELPAAIERQFAGTAGGAPPRPMRVARIGTLVRKARLRRQGSGR